MESFSHDIRTEAEQLYFGCRAAMARLAGLALGSSRCRARPDRSGSLEFGGEPGLDERAVIGCGNKLHSALVSAA